MDVKRNVYRRDGGCCIFCGRPVSVYHANSHVISRAYGGLGIEQNIMTNCIECHRLYDQSIQRKKMQEIAIKHMIRIYGEFDKENLVFKKGKQHENK